MKEFGNAPYLTHLHTYNVRRKLIESEDVHMKNTLFEASVINTDRLVLKSMTDSEWTDIVDHVFDNDECRFQFGYEKSDDLRDMVAVPYREAVIYYSVFLKDELIGYIGLTPDTDNLEFYIVNEYRRNGYACETIRAFISLCVEGSITGEPHNEFSAEVISENKPCIMLLEKLGFTKSGWGMNMSSDYGFYRYELAA